MAEVVATALAGAGLAVDDLAHLDLYSCFASSVHLALRRPRPRTVRPPGRDRHRRPALRRRRGQRLPDPRHRHDGRRPAGRPRLGRPRDRCGHAPDQARRRRLLHRAGPGRPARPRPALQARLDAAHPPVAITDTASGPATVATYSVIHGRDGSAETGLAVVDLPDGTRAYARVDDAALLAEMEATEWVGADGRPDHRRQTQLRPGMSASGPRFDSRGSRIRSQNGRRVGAVLLALVLVAGACSSDDADEADTRPTGLPSTPLDDPDSAVPGHGGPRRPPHAEDSARTGGALRRRPVRHGRARRRRARGAGDAPVPGAGRRAHHDHPGPPGPVRRRRRRARRPLQRRLAGGADALAPDDRHGRGSSSTPATTGA